VSRPGLAGFAVAVVTLSVLGCGGTTKSSGDAARLARQATSPTQQATAAQPSEPSTATESHGHTKPLTRGELIARADLICRRVNAKRAATRIANAGDYARLIPPLAEYLLAAVAEMRKLTPPASMESGWNQIVAYAQESAHSVAEFGQYAKANKLNSISMSGAGVRANERMLAIAKREGFDDCARNR
jgi:hypothetical protein